MRPKGMAVLAGLLALAPIHAQTRESIEIRVMELEATVLDRQGKPVEGLTRDDFTVRIGKRNVPITNFFAVRGGVIASDTPLPAGQVAPATETSIPTSLVIFVDELHLHTGSRKRALDALKRFVAANVGPNTSATLIRFHQHLDVRIRPTEKPGYILAEMDKLIREPFANDAPRERQRMLEFIDDILFATGRADESAVNIGYRINEYAEARTTEVDRTIAALEESIRLAEGFAGRKVLLYVSDGLPQIPGLEVFEYWETAVEKAPRNVLSNDGGMRPDIGLTMRFDRTQALERLVRSAQRADVAFFSFDAGSRSAEGTGAEFETMKAELRINSMTFNMRSPLQYVASETGGLYVANDNKVDHALARISEQFSTYYSIGVKPASGNIHIAVKDRPELRVVAAKRSPPRTREDWIEQSLRTRLYTRSTDNPLDAALEVGTASRVDGQCVVPVRVAVPAPKLPPELTPPIVDVRMVMLNAQNDESPVQHVAVPFQSGRAVHSMMLRVRPQHHVLSVAMTNALSGESAFLQRDIDATTCR